ncbi:MAG TPA: YfbK domain-containing protein, partial [Pirellulaceae bacterium]|nr:YfbK domain-containing protein [Pirellulaceae bacterium]
PEQLSILASAGPSPFGAPLGTSPAQLLQVAVQAGPLAEVSRSPVHLTVALDISASMNMSGRLPAAKLALLHLLDELGPQDRLSLLLFNDRNAYEVIAARREHAASLRALLLQLEGAGGTDLAAAMQRAASLAMSEVDLPAVRRQLVVITDGRAHVSSGTLRSLSELLGDLTQQGLACSVVDVSSDEEPDEQLQKLMVAVPGKLHHARVAADCQWLLVEKLRGRTTMVAPDTTLQVTFDPQAVAAYRLIGHEPTRLAGLEPQAVSIDLRAGQVATGLFEVWLKPNSHDDVATAVVTWLDPASAEPRRSEQRISRLQFAPSFAEAALSLQAAAVAAQAGEVLKQSPFAASRNRDLQAVQELAARVNPRLAARGEFQRYLEVVQKAERVRARP